MGPPEFSPQVAFLAVRKRGHFEGHDNVLGGYELNLVHLLCELQCVRLRQRGAVKLHLRLRDAQCSE